MSAYENSDILFSPNLNIFFNNLPMADRIARLADLGFETAEFWAWWDQDVDGLASACEKHDLGISAFCTKFISLVDPALRKDYLSGLAETLTVAKQLNCRTLISQVGNELVGVPREAQSRSLIAGLQEAAPMLEAAGVTLTIEPLNLLVDHAGYFLARSDEAFEIVRSVASPNVKVLFDVYHQQVTEGNLINNIRKGSELIGHYHIADHPGRQEIGTGEINYPRVIQAIEDTGYRGAIGLELFPKGSHEEALRPFASRVKEAAC